jgi:hypothetical protein
VSPKAAGTRSEVLASEIGEEKFREQDVDVLVSEFEKGQGLAGGPYRLDPIASTREDVCQQAAERGVGLDDEDCTPRPWLVGRRPCGDSGGRQARP